ncbi:MAG: Ig-like domain repeat protein, partial [Acidimicrobiales bacterium]|nr:Ig-like domain repeat protein [Acidimicrobiales bacterium]
MALRTTTLTFAANTPSPGSCSTTPANTILGYSGTSPLVGTVPAGYSLDYNNASLSTAAPVVNDGAINLRNSAQLSIGVVAGNTFTNNGTFTNSAGGGVINGDPFINTPTGSFTVTGGLTVGNGSVTNITNNGAFTVAATGTVTYDNGVFTNGGTLTDLNSTVASIGLAQGLTITGGTICGTPPALRTTTLTFAANPPPGPDCPGGTTQDEILGYSGTSPLVGDIPAGYTLDYNNASLSTTAAVSNYGTLVLTNSAQLSMSGTGAVTNHGTVDVPAGSGVLNGLTFTNAAGSAFTIEGTLTVGNGAVTDFVNDGTVGIAAGAQFIHDNGIFTNQPDGTMAFGITGDNTSTSHYGVYSTGHPISLGGTVDPVFGNGYIPPAGTEYFVVTGGHSGNFSAFLHNSSDDITNSKQTGVGLVGGAPAEASTVAVTSSAATAVYGQPVSLTATVTPSAGGTPTGTVSFYSNGVLLGSQPVTTSAGVTSASIQLSSLRVGTDNITATYNGDVSFDASTSSPFTQTVNQDTVSTSVAPSPTSPVPGQADTLTVTVTAASPGAGTPTGDVSLSDGSTPIPGCQNLVMGPTGPSSVTCTVTYQTVANHTINVTYSGDTDFGAGTGSGALNVSPAQTTTALSSSANPGPIGAPVTYTAAVTVNAPGTGTPTGSVSFSDNGTPVSGCQALALPSTAPFAVQCAETYPANSGHSIVASYSGDTNYAASSGSLSETLQQIGTTTSVGASAPTVTYGQPVTFTATITPASSAASVDPTGTVTFVDNASTTIGSGTVSTTGGVTTATLTLSGLAAGPHSVLAAYGGDTTFTGSTSPTPAAVTVNQASTSVSVSNGTDPSLFGEPVTLTATVNPTSGANPTGTVTFFDNANPIGTQPVSGGQAQLTTAGLAVGDHPITATYSGDSNFAGSTTTATFTQTVNPAATTASLLSSSNPGTAGQQVTYTATVTVNAPGSGTPTGTIGFTDGGNPVTGCQGLTVPASPPLSVQCNQTYTGTASHQIAATFTPGDGNFTGSSANLTESLNTAGTTTSVSSPAPTSTYGQAVTFTATITPGSGGSGNPTGTVTFFDNTTTAIGSGSVSTTAGVTTATLTISTLPAGIHSITATYNGDRNFAGSTSGNSAALSVSAAATTLALASSANPGTVGQAVVYTATVTVSTPGGGTPTGTVGFTDGGNPITGCTAVSLSGATPYTAQCPQTYGTTAGHSIIATYTPGTANYTASQSNTVNETFNLVATTTTMLIPASAGPPPPPPIVSGQNVTLTASVTPAAGAADHPSGTVTFYDNGTTVVGTGTLTTSNTGFTQATFSTTTLAVGPHVITASYGGDTEFQGSTSANSWSFTVTPASTGTTTTVGSQLNPSTVSQSFNLKATITGGTAAPTGTVTFTDGPTTLGSAPLVTQAGVTSAFLYVSQYASVHAIGSHTITATYNGDASHNTSSGTFVQVVAPPIFEDLNLGTDLAVINSATNAVANVFFTGSNNCGCNGHEYLAISPDGSRAYQLSPGTSTSTVHIINTANGQSLGTVTINGWGDDIVMAPNGQNLYVGYGAFGTFAPTLAVISTATQTVAATATISGGPYSGMAAIAINPAGTEIFAALQGGGVSVVNLATLHTVANIALPGASALAVNPNGSAVYATNGELSGPAGSRTLSAISTATNSITRTFGGLTGPVELTVNPAGTFAYVGQNGVFFSGGSGGSGSLGPSVVAVNLSTGTETSLALPSGGPADLAVSADGSKLYVTYNSLTNNDAVYVINPASMTIQTSFSPGGAFAVDDTIRPFAPPSGSGGPPPALVLTTSGLPAATQGVYYTTTLAASGGVAPYSFGSNGPLPAGLTLSPSGVLSGTPTTPGPYTLAVNVTDSNFPAAFTAKTLSLTVNAGSTAPPPCGGGSGTGAPGIGQATNCSSGSNSTPGGSASAASHSNKGTVSVTAHGTGSVTVGQYGAEPSSGLPFRGAGNGFDVALSSANTFTSVTVTDCALAGATTLWWYNPGVGWQAVSPQHYTHSNPPCITFTLSATSSPTLTALNGTNFFGALPPENLSVTL